jgi:PTH2 family peptidyl-tRNA hydrolase
MLLPFAAAPSYIALSLSSLVIGYYLGVGKSLFSYSNRAREENGDESSDDGESYDSEEDTNLTDHKADMNAIKAGLLEDCKLVLIVRTDLKMDKGKIAAQCSHATLACYKALLSGNPTLLKQWERSGQAKVALKCTTEQELLDLEARAKKLNLCARSIRDA